MNRAKQLESLKGMRFMMRREEAERREAAVADMSERRGTVDVGGSSVSRSATILMDDTFDISQHVNGRRKFVARARPNGDEPATAQGGELPEMNIDWSSLAGAAPAEGDADDNATREAGGDAEANNEPSGRRFTVKNSVRAPPLPRSLREAVQGTDRSAKRHRSEHTDAAAPEEDDEDLFSI